MYNQSEITCLPWFDREFHADLLAGRDIPKRDICLRRDLHIFYMGMQLDLLQ